MKKFETVSIPLGELLMKARHRCAWKGCSESLPDLVELPSGWRWLALWWGPPNAPPWAPGTFEDRDAILCPKHASELHNEVLEDIGQRLGETKGRA